MSATLKGSKKVTILNIRNRRGGNVVMKNENIVSMLERLVSEADALSEGKSSVEIDEDPRICGLMLQVESLIEELDQIVLTAFPNHPEKVALWKKAMGIDSDDEIE